VTGQASYLYDGDGNLARGIVNGVVTFYPGRHYNRAVDGANVTVKKFYTLGSTTVAVRTVQGSNDTLNWILGDHLGSTTVTANADGTWNSEIKYTAFGEVRASYGLTPTEYRYTGQLEQAELGLIYFVARFYDPVLTHFVQADTLIPDPGDPLAWDRYAYGLNNPIRYSDPSGHAADAGGGAATMGEDFWKKKIKTLNNFSVINTKTISTNIYIGQNPKIRDVDYYSDYLNDPVVSSRSIIPLIPQAIDFASRFQTILPIEEVQVEPNVSVSMDIDYHVGDVYTVNQVRVANFTNSDLLIGKAYATIGDKIIIINLSPSFAPPGRTSILELQRGGVDLIPQMSIKKSTTFTFLLRCYDCLMMNGYPLAYNWYPEIGIQGNNIQ